MRVVVINGRGGSGKDTVCEIVNKLTFGKTAVVSTNEIVKKLATRMKMVAHDVCGWDGEKDSKGRRLLSDLQDAWTRYDNGPLVWATSIVKSYADDDMSIVFVHSREPHNIAWLKDALNEYDVITMLISRPGVVEHGNHADDEVECYSYDYYLDNDGTLEDLEKKVEVFMKKMLLA